MFAASLILWLVGGAHSWGVWLVACLQQLKRVKRATDKKGGDQTVTEEKFALLFQSNFSVNGELDVSVKVRYMMMGLT